MLLLDWRQYAAGHIEESANSIDNRVNSAHRISSTFPSLVP
jgi:hypothetical protein